VSGNLSLVSDALFEQEPLSVSFSLTLHNVQLSVKYCFCETVTVCHTVQTVSYYGRQSCNVVPLAAICEPSIYVYC